MANTESKNFVVSVTEKNRGFAFIKAASKDEAEEMALEVYNEGNFHWTDSSLSEFEAKEDAAQEFSDVQGNDTQMKAILVSVYKNGSFSNCSNGGVTSKHNTIYLLHPRGNLDIDPNDPPENLCKVVTRHINFRGGYEYKHIEPCAPVEKNKAGYMDGGSMGYTSDSRFGEFSLYPLKIHDRTE